MARENSVSYIILLSQRARLLSTGGLAKKSTLACRPTEKKRERENWRTTKLLFKTCIKNHFYVQKSNGKLFLDGKSRGPLLARVALSEV